VEGVGSEPLSVVEAVDISGAVEAGANAKGESLRAGWPRGWGQWWREGARSARGRRRQGRRCEVGQAGGKENPRGLAGGGEDVGRGWGGGERKVWKRCA
jgi:hypothetical protein